MPSSRVSLGELAQEVGGRLVGDPRIPVGDVTHDSRSAGPGVLFVAVRGFVTDGHRYIPEARAAGTAAVCSEQDPGDGGAAIVVSNTRAALAPLAARVHGFPSRKLSVVGITGTNGKTTATYLLEAIVSAAGLVPGLVGTVGARIGSKPVETPRTTPEASDFQRLLAAMVDGGVDVAAVEVSSHALVLGRVAATRFAAVAFTNLSQDHLDFHGSMESYFAAKASLFTPEFAQQAIIWIDDPAGRRLAQQTRLPVTTVGLGPEADVSARDLEMRLDGSSFVLTGAGEETAVELRLAGDFNVANALVAAAGAAAVGIGSDSIAAGIAAVGSVPGRFEVVEVGKEYAVVVDYAHTPDGVASVIEATRPLVGEGRVIVVLGAGGDRDRAKRPLMGAAASRADVVFLTSDNPRSENPAAIVAEVAAGAAEGDAEVNVEVDRRAAIRGALAAARPGDVVLILGKGHEPYQEFADRVVPFDDRVVAREEAAAS
jgi:UDP-N-acetylmuramoyl-L-alanyl-D-glutamate--2,6-diaminopimelate ligase